MSIQAMAWAIEQQEVTQPGARHVLLCLCNYADQNGDAVFPSVDRLARDTGLDRRSVQRQLRRLEEAIVIVRSNPAIVAARIGRADRRPHCYRIIMTGRHSVTPSEVTGRHGVTNGAAPVRERGGTMPPDPSSDPSLNLKRESARAIPAGSGANPEANPERREEFKRRVREMAATPLSGRRKREGH